MSTKETAEVIVMCGFESALTKLINQFRMIESIDDIIEILSEQILELEDQEFNELIEDENDEAC